MNDIRAAISLLYEIESKSSELQVQEAIHFLEKLRLAGRKEAVVALAPLLDKRTGITAHVRKAVIELTKLFNARDYLALEVRVRESLWSYGWSYQPLYAIDVDDVSSSDALFIYGIYSMHKSGYVREKAVRALARYDSEKILPFLLLRVNDWVPEVSKLASEFLENTLVRSSQVELISNLPLVQHIRTYGRGEKDRLLSQVESRICDDASHEELAEGLKSPIREVRRALIGLLPQKTQNMSLALNALDDPDPIVRSLAFKKISTRQGVSWDTMRTLCRSKYPDQRSLAYTFVAKTSEIGAKEVLMEGLLDRSSSVRSICQYFLASKFQYNPIQYYEMKMPEPVAILGLGETDPKGSTRKIETLLQRCDDPRVLCASLITLGKVDADSYWEIFVSNARSENLGVAVQALKQLLRCGRLAPDLLMDLHSKNDEALKRVMIRLARRLSKWSALSTLLQLYIQESSLLNKQLIVDFLSISLEKQKRVFTSPSPAQSEIIRANVPRIDMLPSPIKEEIILDLKEFEREI